MYLYIIQIPEHAAVDTNLINLVSGKIYAKIGALTG